MDISPLQPGAKSGGFTYPSGMTPDIEAMLASLDVEYRAMSVEGAYSFFGQIKGVNNAVGLYFIGIGILDPLITDILTLNFKRSSVRRLLRDINQGAVFSHTGLVSSDYKTNVWKEDQSLHFEFDIIQIPGQKAHFSFSIQDTIVLTRWLAHNSGVSIKKLCPCNSGKTFKICCYPGYKDPNSYKYIKEHNELSQRVDELVPKDLKPIVDILATENLGSDKIYDLEQFIGVSVEIPESMETTDFWYELGTVLGTGINGSNRQVLAADYFRKSLQIDPNNHGAKLNLAASVEYSEALRLIGEVPETQPRRTVILANTLTKGNRELEAIPLYEKAILEEPEFFLPYARILSILDDNDPVYEHWLIKAATQIPWSPIIADMYAQYMVSCERFQELSEADWINNVDTAFDYSLVGDGGMETQAINAQLLYKVANFVIDENERLFLDIMESLEHPLIKLEEQCRTSRILLVKSTRLGWSDKVEPLYNKVCHLCVEGSSMLRHVESYLANAEMEAGNWDLSIKYSEIVLDKDPQSDEVLHPYYYSLDELDRTEEALSIAKRHYDRNPNDRAVCYDIGFMSTKIGLLGEAQYYYEQNREDYFDTYGLLNLSFILLTQQKFAEAHNVFDRYREVTNTIYLNLSAGLEENAENLDELQQSLGLRIKEDSDTFEALLSFARENIDSFTFAKDLIDKNKSLSFPMGISSIIKPQPYSLSKILEFSEGKNSADISHAKFMMQLESRGDYSVFHTSINNEIPGIERLPQKAIMSLLEGERRFINESPLNDYSTVAVSFAKALEISLIGLVFTEFKQTHQIDIELVEEIQVIFKNKQSQCVNLARFFNIDAHLELGSIEHIFRLCNGRSAVRELLIRRLLSFIQRHSHMNELLYSDNIETLHTITTRYRNPASHTEILSRADAEECRRLCLDLIRILCK